MAPAIFLVPGLWEGPGSYAPLRTALERAGLSVCVTSLLSTGTKYPGNPTMEQDIASIRKDLEQAVEEASSEGVVVVLHSAGGFIGSNSMEGLTLGARKNQGKEGGVSKLIFLAAGVAPLGSDQFGGPFIVNQDDGSCVCKDAKESLFHDLSPEDADNWTAALQVQPVLDHWKSEITYCGWKDVPSTYIVCENDRLLPVAFQEKCAGLAGSKVVRIGAGHMAQLSATEEVSKIITDEASM